MVETRARRKSVAPAGGGAEAAAAAATPSGSGRQAAAAAAAPEAADWADVWRQRHLQELNDEQSSIVRKVKGRVQLFYHQLAITWGWYMLEPWEMMLWATLLALLTYLVLHACIVNPRSACRSALVALHNGLAEQGAKLLNNFAR